MADQMSDEAGSQPSVFESRGSCPACGNAMSLVRITPKSGSLPELRTFRCADCDHVLTIKMEDLKPE
jgi:transposase-like protein